MSYTHGTDDARCSIGFGEGSSPLQKMAVMQIHGDGASPIKVSHGVGTAPILFNHGIGA